MQTSVERTSVSSCANFLAFLASMFLSRIADQILLFLVPLVVFQTTRDVSWSGLAFALETFPRFLSFPICGALCDRISPVRLMRWSQVLRAAVCLAGAVCGEAFTSVVWLVAVSAVCGVLTTQGAMAREVILPQVFKTLRFERVLAYTQTADQLGAVLGPVLAAMLLTGSRWQVAVGATAAIFLSADGAMAYWRRTTREALRPREAAPGGWLDAMKTALKHVVFVPGLRRLVMQAAGVNLVVGVTLASSAALFAGVHAPTAGDYAVLQTAGAIATVLILMGIAHVPVSAERLGAAGFVAIVAGGLLTAIGTDLWAYALGYLLVIGFDKMFNIYLRSSRQRFIPASDYGKTTGVMTLLNNLSQPIAGLALGALSQAWRVNNVILALTVGMAMLGGVSLWIGQRATGAERSL